MGKSKQRHQNNNKQGSSDGSKADSSSSKRTNKVEVKVERSEDSSHSDSAQQQLWEVLYTERHGLLWVLACAVLGALLGFGIGTGHFTGSASGPVSAWRVALGARLRSTRAYKLSQSIRWPPNSRPPGDAMGSDDPLANPKIDQDPSHPVIFSILREAIVREPGGYVHPDLGFMVPAPCGAARGVGMVKKGYHECQTRCIPGMADEKMDASNRGMFVEPPQPPIYRQEEILIRLPLSYQMTRRKAVATLTELIPPEVLQKAPLDDLDDAAILVLYLAHERGLSRASKWLPYIASLPKEPSCGYNMKLRPQYLDSIAAYSDELNLEVQGWPTELLRASRYADKIANGLASDYGNYLKTPADVSVVDNLQWALCQVASRATAGSEKFGSLRLLPLLDQLNHDASAGGFVELTGLEAYEEGDFVEAETEDGGDFIVRSLRHGRRRALKEGQELLVTYNVPQYSPLDWFTSLGFVPPERWGRWKKVDPVLPRVRKDGPFDPEAEHNNMDWLKVTK